MSKSRRHPTSPYLLRRLRSYEEAHAEREGTRDDRANDPERVLRPHEVKADGTSE